MKKLVNYSEKKVSAVKNKELIIIPTTCGTGSEVTNISIAEIKSKKTRDGISSTRIICRLCSFNTRVS